LLCSLVVCYLGLVKKFFCAIGEFEDLAALMSGSHPGEDVHADEPVPRREPEPFLENRGKMEPLPAVTVCSLGDAGGEGRNLVSSQDSLLLSSPCP